MIKILSKISRKDLLYTGAGILLIVSSIIFSNKVAMAQPSCEWDCATEDCCSPGVEKPCNGGTYGFMCPSACVGPGNWTAPIGMCL